MEERLLYAVIGAVIVVCLVGIIQILLAWARGPKPRPIRRQDVIRQAGTPVRRRVSIIETPRYLFTATILIALMFLPVFMRLWR